MNRINLIPPRRRRAKARRIRLRAWAVGVGVYAVALTAAGALLLSGVVGGQGWDHPRTNVLVAREKEAAGAAADSQKQLAQLRARIAHLQQANISTTAVTDSPDYSRLLAVVAHSLGSDVVLNQCGCVAAAAERPAAVPVAVAAGATASAATPAAPVRREMVLSVSGYARSQAAVADYVLRLEELGLFRQVQLLQTTQLSTTDGTVVSFNLSCPLRGVVEDPS